MSITHIVPPYRKASTVVIPQGAWQNVLDFLCERFSHVSPQCWVSRFERGLICDSQGGALGIDAPCRRGQKIFYYRENPHEEPIPGRETILYQDDHLLVADKPPFLPVIPTGKYVSQSLLARLIDRLGNTELQPVHRIDRHTCGLVMFSTRKASRGLYQALFRDQRVKKSYQAIAPPLPGLQFPYHYRSRIVRGDPFFLSREIDGPANSLTVIDVVEKRAAWWRYALSPISGKKHQLRLHMAALGAPIRNDSFYPRVRNDQLDVYANPLQLIAAELCFIDPVSGEEKHFTSRQTLSWPEF